ncbi:transcriptional regulator FilR1 domain-containing protein [Halococcus sediminicola]|uniref:transcriptional regulator FilR1 domain-containing protein n=1 Tax=Halococcus sediminicola TaxID=1264579 RepID=UPI0009AD9623|nr:ArsR family transcriptional regulator [Halococcus sediminicola]
MSTQTHPLSGRDLDIREVINETLDTKRLEILRAVNDLSLPTSRDDIASHAEISQKTAAKHLSELHEYGIVKIYRENIEPTAGGKLLFEAIEDCLTKTTITRDEFAKLIRTETPISILSNLCGEYQSIEEIHRRASVSATKETVKRQLKQFDKPDHDLADEKGHTYRITDTGEKTLLAYDDLSIAVEQIIKKAEWLQRLPLEDATVPVPELSDATVIASDTASPSNVLGAALRLCDVRVEQFRCVCSIYNPILFYAYKSMLDFGVEAEAILDWGSYVKSDQDTGTDFAAHAKCEHYQPLYLEDSHTLGIGIYDDRKVAVGAYNERGEGKHIAMIVSENPKIIEWAESLYDTYREMAHRPEKKPPETDSGFDGRQW